MRQDGKRRWARLVLVTSCAAVPLFVWGCEDAKTRADRKVMCTIAESERLAATDDSTQPYMLLQNAAADTDASPMARAHANLLLAQHEFAQATSLLPSLSLKEMQAGRLINDISQLGLLITRNNFEVAALRTMNPAGQGTNQPLQALAQTKQKLQTEIAAADKEIATVQEQVKAKSQQIADLEAKRNAAATEAAALIEQADKAKGEQTVALFTKGAELRSSAGMLGHSIAAAQADLAKLQQRVAHLTRQKELAAESIKAVEAQAAGLTSSWQGVQKVIQDRAAGSRSIATGKGIEAQVKKLASLLSEADALRKEIDGHLDRAANGYEAAAKAATEVNVEMQRRLSDSSNAPERVAWKKLQDLHSSTGYRLDEARALQARGNLYSELRTLLMSQQRLVAALAPAYKQANLALPPQFGGNLAAQIQAATRTAKQNFDRAEELFKDAIDRGQPSERAQAQFPRLANLYVLYRLTGNQSYLKEARSMLAEMQGEAGDAKAGKVLPVLPDDLEQGVVKRSGSAVQPGSTDSITQPVESGPRGTGGQSTWSKILNRATGGFGSGQGGGPAPAPAPNQ